MATDDIAFIIPAHNEEKCILSTINALLDSGVPNQHIFVVDDRSSDNTALLAHSTGVNVYSTLVNAGNKAGALTAGLMHFNLIERYSWVVFIDGDTVVDAEFYQQMIQASHKYPEAGIIEGQVMSAKNDWIYSAARVHEYFLGHALFKEGQSNFGVIYVAPGCATMFNANALTHCHIGRDTLAEDMDLTLQVHLMGREVIYCKKAKVYTQDPSTFSDYFKQVTRWNQGFWQVVKKYRILSGLRGKRKVEWFIAYIIIESFVFNKFLWMLLSSMALGNIALVIGIDYAISFIVAVMAAVTTKRLDVIFKHPVYYWLSYVHMFSYLKEFFAVVVFGKQLLSWNKVSRTHISSKENTSE